MSTIDYFLERARWYDNPATPLGIHGWCAWRDGRPLKRILARVGDMIRAGTEPFARDDVAAALGRSSARLSGFNLILPSLETTDVVHLLAEDEQGRVTVFHSVRVGELPGKGDVVHEFVSCPAFDSHWTGPAEMVIHGARDVPRFSILLPVHNAPARILRETIASVFQQTFTSWELCVVDDASDHAETRAIVQQLGEFDPRVRVERRSQRGGISRATNRALAIATGEYIVPLDHDDRLLPHALQTLAEFLDAHGEVNQADKRGLDAIYSDEEKITESGDLRQPVLKPAFSPEFLRGVMYVGHTVGVRRTLALEVGGYDDAFDGIQDFEFFLRLSEKTSAIAHVPTILYQWRLSPTSSAQIANVKGDMDALQVRAVEAHLQRLGRKARVAAAGRHRVTIEPAQEFVRPAITWFVTAAAAASPLVQRLTNIQLVPLRDEILAEPNHRELLRSHIENSAEFANAASSGGLIGCLLEPILAASTDWLEHLAFLAAASDTDRVSPVVRSVEDKVLESGRTITSDGQIVPLMRGFDPSTDGYNGSLRCNREVSFESSICWLTLPRFEPVPTRRYHRVCASAWIRVSRSWAAAPRAEFAIPGQIDPFYHSGFDADHADYRLNARRITKPPA